MNMLGRRTAAAARTASQRQSARIIDRQAEMVALVEHGDRKAGIEINVTDILDAPARARQRSLHAGDGSRICGKIGPLGQLDFGRSRDRVNMHPLGFRHAQRPRQPGAGDDDRNGLVHLIAGHGHARIGFGDDAIALGHCGQFLRAALHRRGGMRVRRCHLGKGANSLPISRRYSSSPSPSRCRRAFSASA